jgi:hypothetical protein
VFWLELEIKSLKIIDFLLSAEAIECKQNQILILIEFEIIKPAVHFTLGHDNESYRFASIARMSRKLPPKNSLLAKNFIICTKKA